MKRIIHITAVMLLALTPAMPVSASATVSPAETTMQRDGKRGHHGRKERKHDRRDHHDKRDKHGRHDRRDRHGRPNPQAPRRDRHHHGHRPPSPPPAHRRHAHHGPWCRPVPPPHYRHYAGAPRFTTILGLALGAALDASVTTLVNNGYEVVGYGNDVISLSNVYNVNYLWPEATLYYDNGHFAGGTFTDYTPYNNPARYNGLYNYLTGRYGTPVTVSNNGMSVSGTWFGDGGRFVTLSFGPAGSRFVTTLTYGM